jgi:ABC-type transporter Mla subunit MlaD
VSDYETIQRRRNITVGIFVVIAICAVVWLIFKFGDLPIFVGQLKSYQVSVRFPTAQGVRENTPVRFCGYQIGRVTDVKPPKVMEDKKTGKFYHQTIVVLSIDRKYDKIPADVEVKLMTRGLGSSYIELQEQPFDVNEPPKEFLVGGSVLQGSTGTTSEFFPAESQEKMDELLDSLNTLVKNANDVLGDEENKENLKTALANLSEASQQANQSLEEFQEFFAAGTAMSEELGEAIAQLRVVLEKINSRQGTVGKLLSDGRLYESLLENTEELQMLLQELKLFVAESRDKGLPIDLK